jgi:hypothetical protein
MAAKKITKGETHGCIVCGRPYQLYVVYDEDGNYIDLQVMSPGGRKVPHERRPLVACSQHSEEQVEAAVSRVYGPERDEED